MPPRSLGARIVRIRDWLSFNESVRSLVEILNRQIDAPEKIQVRQRSHPAGYAKEITKRRLSIAEAYLRLVTSVGVDGYQTRLDALATLIHQALHAKTLSMPINTARVQTALMKECVKAGGNLRRQLEFMSDFARASHGQPGVIRQLLGELDLIEVPEDGRQLRDMDLGWDDHVHDAMTEGRKTPSQLVLDAFIQGISRLTVVYYDLADRRIYEEALEAGRILGVRVEVAVEFSVGPARGRQHFIFLPAGCDSVPTLARFLDEQRETLKPFVDGLQVNGDRRKRIIGLLLERFNESQLRQINAPFRNQPFLQLSPLRWEDMEEIIHGGQASRIHLGQLLAKKLRPVLYKRVLYLKNQYRHACDKLDAGETSTLEVENVRARYQEARTEYENCSAESLRDRFGTREDTDYDSAFLRPEDVLPALTKSGGRVGLIHPLSQGAEAAAKTLLRGHEWIGAIETFNLADSQIRDPADLRRLNQLVALLNRGAADEVKKLLADWSMEPPEDGLVERACAWYAEHTLLPRCGSDYVGRDNRVPGIGFISSAAFGRRAGRRLLRRKRTTIMVPVGRLLAQSGRPDKPVDESARVLVLAPPGEPHKNLVGDEQKVEHIGPMRLWRFLNPGLKGLIKVAIGAIPAWLIVGPEYTLLWFFITSSRNTVVDLIAAAGSHVRGWRLAAVDRENLTNSLFWTGFSVPLLGAAKSAFDWAWPAAAGTGLLYAVVKFLALAVTNGLYISTHNKLRGFDPEVVRGNFFRSVLSWPLATLGSFALDLLGIPAIVQTKFWSDVVGGIIEGTGKVKRRMKLSQRNLQELLAAMRSPDRETRLVAMADILFVWALRYQGRSALARLLTGRGEVVGLPDGSKVQPGAADARRTYELLLEAFSAEGSMEALTALMLRSYSGYDAVVLTEVIGEQHQDFVLWLRALAPAAVGREAAPKALNGATNGAAANGNGSTKEPVKPAA